MRSFIVAGTFFLFSLNAFANEALLKAFNERNLEAIKEQLEKGANPNQRDKDGRTLLAEAVWTYQIDIAKLLLEYKANPNLGDTGLNTPLHHACTKSLYEAAELLLQFGANPNAKTKLGTIPLGTAYALSRDAEMTKLLLRYGAKYDDVNLEMITELLGKHPKEFVNRQSADEDLREALVRLENILLRKENSKEAKELLDQLKKVVFMFNLEL